MSTAYELDDAQLALLKYAGWYKSIFELPPDKRPGEDVIEDDAELDAWVQRYQREIAKAAAQAGNGRGINVLGGEEVLVDPMAPGVIQTPEF